MTTLDLTPVARRSRLTWELLDAWVMCRRNLMKTWRVPELLVFATIQPVMFVLLFSYVFGGAIDVGPDLDYVDFLMPGVFVQTVIFGAMMTGIGLANDKEEGLIDRFRSLPMSRSALLTGRTLADLVRNAFIILIMLLVGLAVGFRFGDTTVPAILAGFGVMLIFSYAFSWVSAVIGMSVRSTEAAQSGGMIWVFPLVFASSAFARVDTMPGWLQAFADHQPVTVTVDAVRALFLGGPVADDLLLSLAWCGGILLLFGPLAVRAFRRDAAG
ncbi:MULTISPECIES: ABC transporter permease [Parafrankia]|uniref:Transport permease protein n=1 Tax=Parafrankia soli TaxID=2599596 RepID=A0A1S1Q550_9ACTN|nr:MULTISPECIES: ABC transporter permease [Parafrankia]ABW14356.1 ABC-2 type transporter [Frankia sp. EAN1pec]CAI7978833.1 Transport permease protein [Frankia sp. Hr75.2]OHV28305.1 ABC transporter [Parafrankia soli]TCJ36282.1 ABC transporter permease [Parafrankia sp. BMG5.11]SQD98271.1 ABC-2 type transporter [Parafrankia sp. Ea1.12]